MRSLKKNLFINAELIKKVNESDNNTPIYTKDRAHFITPEMFEKIMMVYNGKKYLKIHINNNMIGHRLGEFVFTRTYKKYVKTNKVVNMKKKLPIKKGK